MNELGIVAYCKKCKKPRLISMKGLCPGCLEYGSIVFDSKINIIKDMKETK